MKKILLSAILLWVTAAAAAPTSPAAREWRTYSVPGGGALFLEVPVAWKEEIRQKDRNLPPTIVLRPKKGQGLEVLLTPIPDQDGKLPAMADLEAGLIQFGMQHLPTARQESVTLEKLEGEKVTGRYFLLTEKQPPPNEYPSVIGGLLLTGPLVVSFTILLHDPDGDDTREALRILQSANFKAVHVGVYRATLAELSLKLLAAQLAGLRVKRGAPEKDSLKAEVADYLVEAEVINRRTIRIRISGENLEEAGKLLDALTIGFPKVP